MTACNLVYKYPVGVYPSNQLSNGKIVETLVLISINESPALKNRAIFKKLIAIFFIQASSASAFAVFYSGLSLYLTKSQNLTSHVATLITGMFLSLNYFLPLIGGLMATHLISYKKLYCLGSSLGFIGCLVLSNKINLYLGLALFLMASLVTNVCLNMFITQMFDSSQVNQRRVAFIWNYIGMNLGFLIGYFLTGLHSISSNYSGIFNIIAIPLCASIILALLFLKEEKIGRASCRERVSSPV